MGGRQNRIPDYLRAIRASARAPSDGIYEQEVQIGDHIGLVSGSLRSMVIPDGLYSGCCVARFTPAWVERG
jgi:hypothetical protein